MRQAFIVEEPTHAALRALNYDPTVERLRKPRRGKRHVPLRELVADLGAGYASVFARIDCDPEFGIELLSQADMFAAEPTGRVIRRDSMQRPERHEIARGDILIAGAGTLAPTELYGRAIIGDGRLAGKYVGQDSMIIRMAEPQEPLSLFAYAYLASPTGLRALRSASYGTKILRIRRDILAELPVPIPDDGTVEHIAKLVGDCIRERDTFISSIGNARAELEGLSSIRGIFGVENARGRRVVMWSGELPTLRAWNFASTGEALAECRRRWKGCLADAVDDGGIYKGGRLTRVPCQAPTGVDLLSQRDVFSIRPIARRIQRPSDSSLDIDDSLLLLASRGQLNEGALFGSIERAAHLPSNAIVTEDITRIRPRDGLGEGLYAFLSTSLGLSLLRSTAYGTSIPGMREDLLARLPIPDAADLKRVSKDVAAASVARRNAARLESEAIRLVEEEVLPSWLG